MTRRQPPEEPLREERVPAGRDTVNVVSTGRGPAVLLLHGWPVTWWHWRAVIRGLASEHRVVAMDLPGFGRSTHSREDYAKKALADVVLTALDALDVQRFAVVGHDWGGSVAYALAASTRERVTALVIEEELLPGFRVDPDGLEHGTYPTWHVGFHKVPELPERMIRGHEREYYGYFWDLTAGPGVIDAATRDRYLEVYSSEDALAGGLELYRTAERDAAENRLLSDTPLTIPVLAIGGDRAIGHGVEKSVRHVARRVEAHVIPECGHYPAQEHPTEWLELVRPFLQSAR